MGMELDMALCTTPGMDTATDTPMAGGELFNLDSLVKLLVPFSSSLPYYYFNVCNYVVVFILIKIL